MKTQAERLQELLEITRAITGSEDYAAVLELIVEKARAFTDASACVLLLAQPGAQASIVASAGVAPDTTRGFRAALDERVSSVLRDALRLEPGDAILAVPMIVRGRLRGVLATVRAREPERAGEAAQYTKDDEYLLSGLADQAAIALGNAAHFRELEEAIAAADRERRAREAVLEALSEERSWLRAVIEHSPVGVILVQGSGGERVTANPRAQELLGLRITEEGGIAQYANELCTPDGTPLPRDESPSNAAARGEHVHRELAIRQPDGTVIPVLASAAAIRDQRGNVLGAVVLYEDISAVKDIERMREEWTSIVAHDLRQPLTGIAGRAQVIAKQNAALGARIAHETEQILSSTDRLNRMIHDLLDISLMEARHLPLARGPHDVRPMLDDIVEHSAGVTGGHRVELEVAEGLPSVDVDADRIEQVVTNLLSNAVRYGAPETPIEVRAEGRDGVVEITVRNEGPGIAPDVMKTLFTRFQKAKASGGGMQRAGLGLYISKGIVEAHGGRIWVESTPGAATAFHFTLPATGP